jgi:hypothetical protein
MGKTKGYMPFWGEFLLCAFFTLGMLAQVIYELTRELLFLALMGAMVVTFSIGMLWVAIKKRKIRIKKGGILGLFLLGVSSFMTEWIWVMLCMVLLGGGLILYDVVSKRGLSDAERGD